MFLIRVILWYAMLSYVMVWYGNYGMRFLSYAMRFLSYAMVYVVNDTLSATVCVLSKQ